MLLMCHLHVLVTQTLHLLLVLLIVLSLRHPEVLVMNALIILLLGEHLVVLPLEVEYLLSFVLSLSNLLHCTLFLGLQHFDPIAE